MKKISMAIASAVMASVMAISSTLSAPGTAFADSGNADYEIACKIGNNLKEQLVHTIQPATLQVRKAEESLLDATEGDIRELNITNTLAEAFPEMFDCENAIESDQGFYYADVLDTHILYAPGMLDRLEINGASYSVLGNKLDVNLCYEPQSGYYRAEVSYNSSDVYSFRVESDDIVDEAPEEEGLGTYILTAKSSDGYTKVMSPVDLATMAILTEFAENYAIGLPEAPVEEETEPVLGPPIAITPVMSLDADIDDVAEYVVEKLSNADVGAVNHDIEARLDAGEDIRDMRTQEFIDWRNLELKVASGYMQAELFGTHVLCSGQSFNKLGSLTEATCIVDVPSYDGSGYTCIELNAASANKMSILVSRWNYDGTMIDSTNRNLETCGYRNESFYTIQISDDSVMDSDMIALLRTMVGFAFYE